VSQDFRTSRMLAARAVEHSSTYLPINK
jgi:hypothetical protein